MFKHNFDFGFEIDNSQKVDDDIPDNEASLFLDFKDADDIAEAAETGDEAADEAIMVPSDRRTFSSQGFADVDTITNRLASSTLGDSKQNSYNQLGNPEVLPGPKPILDTSSPDFEANLLSLVLDLQSPKLLATSDNDKELHNSLYDFALRASPYLIQLLLESVGNPEQLAFALQRIRMIVGVSDIDPSLEYQFYYVFSYCNDQMLDDPSDWENIIALTMDEIVNEIFTGSIYMLSDHEINVILLPTNLTHSELELIRSNRIWGLRTKENLLSDLNQFLQIETCVNDDGQDLQLEMIERFMLSVSNLFPNLNTYKLGHMMHIGSYLARFNWIRETIDKFLPKFLDDELEKQAELLLPFIRPTVS